MQTYQLGTVFEFCPWVVGLRVHATTILFPITLEFRKEFTEIHLSLSGLKSWATTALLKPFILKSLRFRKQVCAIVTL